MIRWIIPVAALAAASPAADWPQWRGPDRDAVWHEGRLLQSFPKTGLAVSWRAPIGAGWSSPIVSQGRVYVTDVEIVEKSATERILCFDEASGRQTWVHRYPVKYPEWALTPEGGGPRSTPIVRSGKLYTLGALGNLFCLDAKDGEVRWEKKLADDYQVQEFTGITSSPLIEGDLLILYICGKPNACVVAFNKDSGKEVWRALNDSFTYSSPIVISAGGAKQLIVWTQAGVTSLDLQTGRTFWREEVRTPGDMAVATPVWTKDLLYAAGLMFRLDPAKPLATALWPQDRTPAKRVLSNTSTPLLQGDFLFSARSSGELVCLDAATGRQLWQTNTVTDLRYGASIHLTANGNFVFLFTNEGNLIRARFDNAGYHELDRAHLLNGTYQFGGRKVVWSPPAYANQHVLVRNDRELIRVSVEDKLVGIKP